MGTSQPGPPSKLDEVIRRLDQEWKRAVNTINDEVVPAVRRDGGRALRELAKQMHHFANSLDPESTGAAEKGSPDKKA